MEGCHAADPLSPHRVLRISASIAVALVLGCGGALAVSQLMSAGLSTSDDAAPAGLDPVAASSDGESPSFIRSTPTDSVEAATQPVAVEGDAAAPASQPRTTGFEDRTAEEQRAFIASRKTDSLEQRAARERLRRREQAELRRELTAEEAAVEDNQRAATAANPPRTVNTLNAKPRPIVEPAAPRTEPARPGPATLAYWNSVNSLIEQEEKMRAAPSEGVSNSNASDFTDRRIAAGEFAASGIRQLAKTGVDAELIAFAERLAVWYAKGVEICKKGKYLLEKADAKTRKGPQGKEWQKQDKEHQQSVGTLNTQGEALRTKLGSKYRLAFPPLK